MNRDETEQESPLLDAAELGSLGILTVGDLLGTTFRVFTANFIPFLAISAVLVVPFGILELVSGSFLVSFLALPALFLMQAVVVFATVQHMAGREVSVGAAIQKGLSKFLPVLGGSLLVTLIVLLGFLLLIAPGIILQFMFFLTIPAIVAEDLGPIQGMKRSVRLTEGHKMKLFLGAVVLGSIQFIGGLLAFGFEASAGFSGIMAIGFAFDMLSTALLAVFTAVAYARLRGIREDMDVNKLLDVFA